VKEPSRIENEIEPPPPFVQRLGAPSRKGNAAQTFVEQVLQTPADFFSSRSKMMPATMIEATRGRLSLATRSDWPPELPLVLPAAGQRHRIWCSGILLFVRGIFALRESEIRKPDNDRSVLVNEGCS
ncbi:MAG: hypothetical protein ACK58L_21910, partial [Planctomycetota bacterium]